MDILCLVHDLCETSWKTKSVRDRDRCRIRRNIIIYILLLLLLLDRIRWSVVGFCWLCCWPCWSSSWGCRLLRATNVLPWRANAAAGSTSHRRRWFLPANGIIDTARKKRALRTIVYRSEARRWAETAGGRVKRVGITSRYIVTGYGVRTRNSRRRHNNNANAETLHGFQFIIIVINVAIAFGRRAVMEVTRPAGSRKRTKLKCFFIRPKMIVTGDRNNNYYCTRCYNITYSSYYSRPCARYGLQVGRAIPCVCCTTSCFPRTVEK